MVTRRQAVNIAKNDIARKIEEVLFCFRAERCDDDSRVVKVPITLTYDDHGEVVHFPAEFEIYIKEVQG